MPVASFDHSAADAYATVTVPASSVHKVALIDVMVPAATFAGYVTAFDIDSAQFINLQSDADAFYMSHDGHPWQFETYSTTATGPTVPVDTNFRIDMIATWQGSGTLWDIEWKFNSTTLFTDTGVDLGINNTNTMSIPIGAIETTFGTDLVFYIGSVEIRNSSDTVVFSDDFSSGDFSSWDGGAPTGSASVVVLDVGGAGGVRVSIAFNDVTLEPSPTWTDVTAISSSLVAGYDIDRGRSLEFDPTDAATATVTIKDRAGVLDPTNSSSAYTGLIEPDLQIKVELWDPCAEEWSCRFRGWVENYDYDEDGAGVMATVTITCYDIFSLLSRIEMQPGQFGDTPPVDGVVFFDNATFQDRITQVYGNAGIPSDFFVAFSGNVNLLEGTYSPGQSPMEVVQDCCDAEFPGVSNTYPDRFGRGVAHGRLAVFDPAGTAASTTPDVWDYRHWKCGDGEAVAASASDTAHIRPPYTFNRGIDEIINSATASPQGIADADVAGQLVTDPTSIGVRGIKSWSKENLLVDNGILTGNNGNDECKLFATFYVANYAEPRNRVTTLTFRSQNPSATGAAANWLLLTHVDIADRIDLTAAHPGGGGFNAEPFYIQGVRESCEPLNPSYANVTLTLQVSPKALFDNPEGLDGN